MARSSSNARNCQSASITRQAFREIERVERQLAGGLRFAFRHFPLTEIHPHALAAAAAAEAAANHERFWEMHGRLFHGQNALEEEDLRRYARDLALDADRFDEDRASGAVFGASGETSIAASIPARFTARRRSS